MPRLLQLFRQTHPGVFYQLRQGNSGEMLRLLSSGQADLAFTDLPPDSRRHVIVPICDESPVLIAPVTPYYQRLLSEAPEPSLLLREPIIVRERQTGTRDILQCLLKSLGLSEKNLRVFASVNRLEAVKILVAQGNGIAVVSRIAVLDMEKRGQLLCYPLSLPENSYLYMSYLKQLPLHPQAQDFAELARHFHQCSELPVKLHGRA